MIIIKKGNILEAKENVICHQVNVEGIMGGGLALQIAKLYPNVENEYKDWCQQNRYSYKALCGDYKLIKINDNQFIANCFTQMLDFTTDYSAIVDCFGILLKLCQANNWTIAVPYGYGCGIAKGDWNIVSKIFEELSNNNGIDIVIYKLEDNK